MVYLHRDFVCLVTMHTSIHISWPLHFQDHQLDHLKMHTTTITCSFTSTSNAPLENLCNDGGYFAAPCQKNFLLKKCCSGHGISKAAQLLYWWTANNWRDDCKRCPTYIERGCCSIGGWWENRCSFTKATDWWLPSFWRDWPKQKTEADAKIPWYFYSSRSTSCWGDGQGLTLATTQRTMCKWIIRNSHDCCIIIFIISWIWLLVSCTHCVIEFKYLMLYYFFLQ